MCARWRDSRTSRRTGCVRSRATGGTRRATGVRACACEPAPGTSRRSRRDTPGCATPGGQLARTRGRAARVVDRRVARLLGVPVPVAHRLLDGARARTPSRGFGVRVAAFLFATTSTGRLALPLAARERAVHSLVGP